MSVWPSSSARRLDEGVAVASSTGGVDDPHAPPHSSSRLGDFEPCHSSANEEPTFHDVLSMLLFIVAIWVAGKVAIKCRMPDLVGQLCAGILLGPNVADLAPEPSALRLYGELGLMLLVIEAGLDVDLQMLRMIGARGIGVAVTGTALPILIAGGLGFIALGMPPVKALAAGCVLAPTSMGIALNVLKRCGILNTPTGQLIIASAVLDDVIALILLALLQTLGDDGEPYALLLPVVSSVGMMFAALVAARHVVPRFVPLLIARVSGEETQQGLLLGLVLGLAACLAPLCHSLKSSHLLGAFLGGLSFCSMRSVHDSWRKQVKRVLQFLVRLFFAATVGFAVPVKSFGSAAVFGRALVFFLAIGGKLATGLWATPLHPSSFFTIGLAMSAWGEFAFILAQAAFDMQLIDDTDFAALILAVLISIIISPVLLRRAIYAFNREAKRRIEAARRLPAAPRPAAAMRGGGPDGLLDRRSEMPPVCYTLRTRSAASWGLSDRLGACVRDELDLQVLDFRSQQTGEQVNFELFLRDSLLRAPATLELDPPHEQRLSLRQGQIVNALQHLFEGGGKCQLQRWIPKEHEGSTAAAAILLKDAPAHPAAQNGGDHHSAQQAHGGRAPSPAVFGEDEGEDEGEGMAEEREESGRSYKASRPTSLDGFISGYRGRRSGAGARGAGARRRRHSLSGTPLVGSEVALWSPSGEWGTAEPLHGSPHVAPLASPHASAHTASPPPTPSAIASASPFEVASPLRRGQPPVMPSVSAPSSHSTQPVDPAPPPPPPPPPPGASYAADAPPMP